MVSLEMSVLFGHVQIFGGAAVVVVVVGRFCSFGWLMSYKNFGTMGTVTKMVNYRSRIRLLTGPEVIITSGINLLANKLIIKVT